eukprot:Em0001g2697a
MMFSLEASSILCTTLLTSCISCLVTDSVQRSHHNIIQEQLNHSCSWFEIFAGQWCCGVTARAVRSIQMDPLN